METDFGSDFPNCFGNDFPTDFPTARPPRFAETAKFNSPWQSYASNVPDSDCAPEISLAVKSLASSLRPVNHAQHGIHRRHRQGK